MSELTLTEIWIYPIKSLGGIRLKEAKVLKKGLALDRRWMLVDDQGVFLTQRIISTMALFKLSLGSDELIITFNGDQHEHRISTNTPPSGQTEQVKIWDDTVDAMEVATAASAWFSEKLKMKCRLVSFPEEKPRAVDSNFKINDDHVSLADAYPFLIIGQQSLNFLNSKLEIPLPMNRFRPNFVFAGGEPNVEDTWRDFTIGNNQFVGVKPCARCVLTTVNQDTAEKGIEPLRTLATYRKKENKILFGQNLIAVNHQTIKEGDIITIQTRL
jgi:uncharacterized protein YcbX